MTDHEKLLDLLWPGGTTDPSSLSPAAFATIVAAVSVATGTDLQLMVDEAARLGLGASRPITDIAA